MKFVVGLTGQTGAGKSSLWSTATKNGFLVIDCDAVAHEVQQRESVKRALCDAFGADILSNDGRLDRRALASKAFETKDKTELLNKTVLPFIVADIEKRIDEAENDYILLDAPTLFESGADSMCQVVIGVIADEQKRIDRIIKRDMLTDLQAKSRVAAGKSDEFYKEKCDYVLSNNVSVDEFINNFEILIKDILGGKKNG